MLHFLPHTVLLQSFLFGRDVQPLAGLYPTVMLSPWRQVRKKYPLQGMDPRSHLICTPPRMGHPSWFPLVPSTGGYGPHPRRLIRTPVQGDYPRYHSITSPLRRAPLLVPLPLELSASLPPEVAHYLANWKSLLTYFNRNKYTPFFKEILAIF